MEARAQVPVSLPNANPTLSYWQDPPDAISNHRSSADLPPTADYVIIGSGISGACIAWNLLEKKPNSTIVMLEARQACSGATGRNGGHTKAASYRSFLQNTKTHSRDEAVKIARLQVANIAATHAFAATHSIPCDSHPCKTVDVALDEPTFNAGLKAVEFMNAVAEERPELGLPVHRIWGKEEVRKRFFCPRAVGGFEYEAGSISAYGFVVGVLKLCLERGLNLQTNTPATRLELIEGEEAYDNWHDRNGSVNGTTNGHSSPLTAKHQTWHIQTQRGVISTPNVILATNGYTAALWSQFQGVVVPLRGQITAQRPGRNMPRLDTTYSFTYSTGYEYMIARPPGSKFAGDIVIGGGWGKLRDGGAQEFGLSDDSGVNEDVGRYLRDCTEEYFGGTNWGEDHVEGRVRREWSGIMGNSADGLPYVGEVPGQKGLWVSVSFDGHGMVLCLKCAEAVVKMMCGNEEERGELEGWFPESFRVTEERFKIAWKGRKLAEMPVDATETKARV